ncbi:MAG: hypothetical protein J5642_04390 [Bacteroidales bacterium]|nr:hypothetical protein [Bacteroidales bacterium]
MKTRFLQLIVIAALFAGTLFNLSAQSSSDFTRWKIKAVVAEITRDCRTDYEKAQAIYEWIVRNVDYNHDLVDSIQMISDSVSIYDPLNSDSYMRNLNEEMLGKGVAVFEKRSGICSNISHLYKLMCTEAGLRCKIVLGINIGLDGIGGHAWNIVEIHGKKHLVDVTAGIGARELTWLDMLFPQSEKRNYFDASPSFFIKNGYYPLHKEDQCLSVPITVDRFAGRMARLYKGFLPNSLVNYIKKNYCSGILEMQNLFGDIACDF